MAMKRLAVPAGTLSLLFAAATEGALQTLTTRAWQALATDDLDAALAE